MPETRRKCAGGMVCELVTRFSLWGVPFYFNMRKETYYLKTKLLLKTISGFIEKNAAFYCGRVETGASTPEFGSGYKVAMRDVLHLVEQLEEQNEMEWGK